MDASQQRGFVRKRAGKYVEFTLEGETYYLARLICCTVFGEKSHEGTVVKTMSGSKLCGMEYSRLYRFDGVKYPREKGWYVVSDDYVTLTDGTGIVHIAPAFGEDDARVGRDNHLPFVQLVDTQGKFVEGTPWAGEPTKEVNEKVLADLKARGLLFAALPFTHNYPFCWRCDTPLLYYARSTWFIRMTAAHDQLMANNRTVNWMPDNIKEGRFGNFLIMWWIGAFPASGTGARRLPIWICEDGHMHVIGSKQELRDMATAPVAGDIELPPLHRRGGNYLPRVRQAHAPRAGSDRLLVR